MLRRWKELLKCKIAKAFLGYETEYCKSLREAEEKRKAKKK